MLSNTKLRQKIKGEDYMPQMKTTACPVTIVEVPAVPPWGWLGLEKSTAISPRQDWTPQKPCKHVISTHEVQKHILAPYHHVTVGPLGNQC